MLTRGVGWSAGAEAPVGPTRPGTPGPVRSLPVPGDSPRASTGRRPLWTWAVVGTVGAVGLAVFGTGVAAVPHGADWWFSLPHGDHVLLEVAFYLSVGLLVA